ncbi:inner membrane protein YhjD [Mycolicibacterium doricum]|uniref:Inner membrane protein YhjD n=1 Tax=Mycolicibacterium doricum TaxID=126673 RepID=A0A1X1TME7_9MYCO|nr:inner membrane protein YhjD [Mycolicibacterium doricum]MCV7269809.1 inner membrane protein YhjD [Mycolicibacterium doricum]ORV45648.1 inner membrane protein YhjD [Mycolicibacterium doricum]BBZ06631.1 inner membrane protein YhjD [Mycolicibacterium doricum]
MEQPAKPGVIDRLRARYAWFDHLMRAQGRYRDSKGDFFAAAVTYFTVFALFPLTMVGFSIGGFVLANRPDLLARLQGRIRTAVSGDMGQQVIEVMNSAIESRTSVGLIGLATATWAGLGWMNNLREALSQMWGQQRGELSGFIGTKLSDLLALVSTFLALAVTIGLTALGDKQLMRGVLDWLQVPELPGLSLGLRITSLLVSVLVSWLLFTWIIARLPRESISFRSSVRAGLLAAVAFEIFKQAGSLYLQSVVNGPAGATFGPVLGLMVFAYITARLILFSTAWAATSRDNMLAAPVDPPGPAQITTSVQVRDGVGLPGAVAAAAVGALGAVGISWLRRRQ